MFYFRNALLILLLSLSTTGLAQNIDNFIPVIDATDVVGSDAFLQGENIELGIRGNGSFVSSVVPPSGYHPDGGTSPTRLGLIVDMDRDGWDVGIPNKSGDFFRHGSPFEGFKVEFNGVQYECMASKPTTIPGSVISVTDLGNIKEAVWVGEVTGLFRVTQKMQLSNIGFNINVETTITNLTSSSATVYYTRVADPDQEYSTTGSYRTDNRIVNQIGVGGASKSIVSCRGETYGQMYYAMLSFDPRSKVCIASMWDNFPSVYYNGGSDIITSGSLSGDVAIAITFFEPSLGSNQETSFEMIGIFREVDEAIEQCETPIDLTINIETKNATCSGADGGVRLLSITGGQAPYIYNYGFGSTLETFERDIPAGEYTLFIRDSTGCSDTLQYTINKSSPDLGLNVATEAAVCQSMGLAIAETSLDTGPLQYNWEGTFISSDSAFLNVGSYTLFIIDTLGCEDSTDFIISRMDSVLSFSLETTNGICESPGKAKGTVFGGVEPYSFQWDGLTYTEVDSSVFLPGSYTAYVMDSNGCTTSEAYQIDQTVLSLTVSLDLQKSTCGEENGIVKASASGGVLPYLYYWEDVFVPIDSFIRFAGFNDMIVKDSNGCIGGANYEIEDITPVPDFSINVNDNIAEFSNTSSFFTDIAWSFGSALENTASNSVANFPISITYPKGGTYPVTLRAFYGPNCSRTITQNVVIEPCEVDLLVTQSFESYENPNIVKAKNSISGESLINPGANVQFGSNNSISLLPGMLISTGAIFETVLEGCNY